MELAANPMRALSGSAFPHKTIVMRMSMLISTSRRSKGPASITPVIIQQKIQRRAPRRAQRAIKLLLPRAPQTIPLITPTTIEAAGIITAEEGEANDLEDCAMLRPRPSAQTILHAV